MAAQGVGAWLRLDRYVVETLMADLVGHDHSAASFLVYLFLWSECAKTRGRSKTATLSLREIAEGTGLSKRAVQTAVARLKRRQLLSVEQTTITAVPVYSVQTPWRRLLLALLLVGSTLTAPLRAETSAAPEAPAVVLSRLAELRFGDPERGIPSTLDVRLRTQILTPAGASFAQATVVHSEARRLELLEGRTIRPDGSSVPLSAEGIFVQDLGEGRKQTRATLPAVEVGAIAEVHFRLRWETIGPEVWTFDGPLPTLVSELVFHTEPGTSIAPAVRGPATSLVQATLTPDGGHGRLRAENLPAVIEEPHALPLADLETRVVAVPLPLFDSWRTVARRFEVGYDRVRSRQGNVRKKARTITAGMGSLRGQVVALHAFVRDHVRATGGGIGVDAGSTLDLVLERSEGRHAEKALLLQAMLESSKIPAKLVWAFDWRDGYVDPAIVHPGALARVLVLAGPDGQAMWLDPDDPGLAAGRLAPVQEGTQAIVVDREAPRIVALPPSPAADNRRAVELVLALNEGGRLDGRGRLVLTGHHAWFHLGGRASPETARDAWQRWLEASFPDFAIGEVVLDEALADQRLTLSWVMREHPELVLGEEASLQPSRPLGPIVQRYAQPPESRRTPVLVSFPDLDTVTLELSWPEGWEIEHVPADLELASSIGAASATTLVDREQRRLSYTRKLEISARRCEPGEPYAALRGLYATMERHDAQELVAVRLKP